MVCGAKNKDGTQCLKEATDTFGVFPGCKFHVTMSRDFQFRKNRESYQKGYEAGRSSFE